MVHSHWSAYSNLMEKRNYDLKVFNGPSVNQKSFFEKTLMQWSCKHLQLSISRRSSTKSRMFKKNYFLPICHQWAFDRIWLKLWKPLIKIILTYCENYDPLKNLSVVNKGIRVWYQTTKMNSLSLLLKRTPLITWGMHVRWINSTKPQLLNDPDSSGNGRILWIYTHSLQISEKFLEAEYQMIVATSYRYTRPWCSTNINSRWRDNPRSQMQDTLIYGRYRKQLKHGPTVFIFSISYISIWTNQYRASAPSSAT